MKDIIIEDEVKYQNLNDKIKDAKNLFDQLKINQINMKLEEIFIKYQQILKIISIDSEINYEYLNFLIINKEIIINKQLFKKKEFNLEFNKYEQTLTSDDIKKIIYLKKNKNIDTGKDNYFIGEINDLIDLLNTIKDNYFNLENYFFYESYIFSYGIPPGLINNNYFIMRYLLNIIKNKINLILNENKNNEDKSSFKNIIQKIKSNKITKFEKKEINFILNVIKNREKREKKINGQLLYETIKKFNIEKIKHFDIIQLNNKLIDLITNKENNITCELINLFLEYNQLIENGKINIEKIKDLKEENLIDIKEYINKNNIEDLNIMKKQLLFILIDEYQSFPKEKFTYPELILKYIFKEIKLKLNSSIEKIKYFTFLFNNIIFGNNIGIEIKNLKKFDETYLEKILNYFTINDSQKIYSLAEKYNYQIFEKENNEIQIQDTNNLFQFNKLNYAICNIIMDIHENETEKIIMYKELLFDSKQYNYFNEYTDDIKDFLKKFIKSKLMIDLLNESKQLNKGKYIINNDELWENILNRINYWPYPKIDIDALSDRILYEIITCSIPDEVIFKNRLFKCPNSFKLIYNLAIKIRDLEHEIFHFMISNLYYLGYIKKPKTDEKKKVFYEQDFTNMKPSTYVNKFLPVKKFESIFIEEENIKEDIFLNKKRNITKKVEEKKFIKDMKNTLIPSEQFKILKDSKYYGDAGDQFENMLITGLSGKIEEFSVNQIFMLLDEDALNLNAINFHFDFIEIKKKDYIIDINKFQTSKLLNRIITENNIKNELLIECKYIGGNIEGGRNTYRMKGNLFSNRQRTGPDVQP